jgi:hypothetical protein
MEFISTEMELCGFQFRNLGFPDESNECYFPLLFSKRRAVALSPLSLKQSL